jgi:hypothetical protein
MHELIHGCSDIIKPWKNARWIIYIVMKNTGRSGGWNEEAKAGTEANNGNVQYRVQRSTHSKTKGTHVRENPLMIISKQKLALIIN